MKISETSNQMPELNHSKKSAAGGKAGRARRPGGVADLGETEFAQALFGSTEKKLQLEMDQLLVQLDEQGQRLSHSQTFEEMGRYKALVMTFIDKVVNQIYRVQEVPVSGSRSQGKIQVILRKVDENLAALANEVLSKQAAPLKILARVGQIRGLLLDLYK